MEGTSLEVRFHRVVDGDTIGVFLPGQTEEESLRILALDTEESHPGGSKPVTPWGREAKRRAGEFFADAETVTLEFPGTEPVEEAVEKYRGNFGRLLVYVHLDGVDYQETMIREGFSPYFVKYGNAGFASLHDRYRLAERDAQQLGIGVWDQIGVNGSVVRDYATLGTWWQLRAAVIDDYRARKAEDPSLLNTRLDHELLRAKAEGGEEATVFTELRSIRRVGGIHGLISTGSRQQPFDLFLPEMDSPSAREIVQLLENRYISAGESRPRRSYGYASGALSLFRGEPQMVLESADQVRDVPELVSAPAGGARIAELLPNPQGPDRGFEQVVLGNTGAAAVPLDGWRLEDRAKQALSLDGRSLPPREEVAITLGANTMPLNNSGDEVRLIDAGGAVRHKVEYRASDVVSGLPISFR